MILKSDNIRLRPFESDDLEKLFEWKNDPELRLLAMFHPYPVTLEQEREWLNSILTDKSNKLISFAVVAKENNRLIGYFQLRQIDLVSRNAFLSIIIGDKMDRGKGFGSEILRLGLDYGFSYLGLHKISLDVLSINEKAIKLYEKYGFIKEGHFKSQFFFNGNFYDVLRMAVFADNFIVS